MKNRLSSNFDAIIASAPLNATAGAVTSKSKDHYDPKIMHVVRKYSDIPVHSDVPFKLVPHPKADSFIDLTGKKYGRFTVVGYLGRLNPKNDKKGVWLCRCVCGNYETRGVAAIKKALDPDACCAKCNAWKIAKRRYEREGGKSIEQVAEENSK